MESTGAISDDGDINPYELLGVAVDATEAEIRTAYRTGSLKVHPDRNRDDPNAARKFHTLNQAYMLLLDPLRRLALDAKLRLAAARQARSVTYDSKRKILVSELEDRERAAKKARVEKQQEDITRGAENDRVSELGRRLREEKARQLKEKEEALGKMGSVEEDPPPTIDTLDTTIKLKYTLINRPDLETPGALATLLSPFGKIDASTIVISLKTSRSKKKASAAAEKKLKYATALIPFEQLSAAFAAVSATGLKERGLTDVDVTWAGGTEPLILDWLRRRGELGSSTLSSKTGPSTTTGNSDFKERKVDEGRDIEVTETTTQSSNFPFLNYPSSPSSIPPVFATFPRSGSLTDVAGIDYESLTLMRMRQAERERLEREIREQEEG